MPNKNVDVCAVCCCYFVLFFNHLAVDRRILAIFSVMDLILSFICYFHVILIFLSLSSRLVSSWPGTYSYGVCVFDAVKSVHGMQSKLEENVLGVAFFFFFIPTKCHCESQ